MGHHKKPEVKNSNIGHNRLRLSVKKNCCYKGNCSTQVKGRVIIKPKDKNTVVINITY
jgi:hypothetical protein